MTRGTSAPSNGCAPAHSSASLRGAERPHHTFQSSGEYVPGGVLGLWTLSELVLTFLNIIFQAAGVVTTLPGPCAAAGGAQLGEKRQCHYSHHIIFQHKINNK